MSIREVLYAIEASAIGQATAGTLDGWSLLFPIMETIHVLCLAVTFGSIVLLDLRLLGLISRDSPVSRLTKEVLPYTWTAFICAVLSGSTLFTAHPVEYFFNLQFRLKFLCMFLAGINMLVFHSGAYRRVLSWDSLLPPPIAARVAGSVSIAMWLGVVVFGRWIGFTAY
ncbi:MAG: DUF6644 family protein [Pseudomonadota bacterium]|nr:DUF6644 family protein [Pseudomonadota bacterium]